MAASTTAALEDYYIGNQNDGENFHSPFDVPKNTHITIGVVVGVGVLIIILVVIWCFKPCATRDNRTKGSTITCTSIASN